MARSISTLLGHLLVATPNLIDTHFSKSVIYVCEDDAQGILGIVINKPLGISLQRVFEQLGIENETTAVGSQDVMMGGPVGTDHGFILYHQTDTDASEDTIHISNSPTLLTAIAQGRGPKDYLLSLGYAGWERKQLRDEISRNDWLVVPISDTRSRELIFDVPAKDRWNKAVRLLGYPPYTISAQVGHA
jgi:putative transcriptional regulator